MTAILILTRLATAAGFAAVVFLYTSAVAKEPLHLSWKPESHEVQARWDIAEWTKEGAVPFVLGQNGPPGPPQLAKVVCDGDSIAEKNGEWLMPQGCQTLAWSVPLLAEADTNMAEQRSFLAQDDQYVLLSDLYSMLRPKGSAETYQLGFEHSVLGSDCLSISTGFLCDWNVGGPPDFILLTANNMLEMLTGQGYAHITPGREDQYAAFHEGFEGGLEYLRFITKSDDDVLIYWAQSCLDGWVSAATGEQLIIISRACGENEHSHLRVLLTLFHEVFHIFTKGQDVQALWAGESLASYYGLKSMEGEKGDTEAGQQLVNAYLGRGAPSPGYGLLDAQLKVQDGSDPGAYAHFYFRGAAFWRSVDQFIQLSTDDKKTLDDYLPLLFAGGWGPDGELPMDFVEAMRLYDATFWDEISGEYL